MPQLGQHRGAPEAERCVELYGSWGRLDGKGTPRPYQVRAAPPRRTLPLCTPSRSPLRRRTQTARAERAAKEAAKAAARAAAAAAQEEASVEIVVDGGAEETAPAAAEAEAGYFKDPLAA